MGRIIKDVYENKNNGYKPTTGVYISNTIFQGEFDKEIKTAEFFEVPTTFKEVSNHDDKKGLQSNYKTVSLKSHDGNLHTFDQPGDFWDEENPNNYKYTDLYYQSPDLRAMLDWFKVDKCRIRVFQLQPGCHTAMHTDMDNERGQEFGETLRILIQLNDTEHGSWVRFRSADSDVSIPLRKGQFVIFNPDNTAHQSDNMSAEPRDAIMMIVKRNAWIDSIINNTKPCVIDVKKLQELAA
jgi:hypothetical protein